MFKICNSENYNHLISFLSKDPLLNTFLIADIESYGFDKEYQKVFTSLDNNGFCQGVALIYYNNLILSGTIDSLDFPFILNLIKNNISTIMGEATIIKYLSTLMKNNSLIYSEKVLYTLNDTEFLSKPSNIKIGTLNDVDNIYNFLSSIDEIKHFYTVKEMIINRLINKEGKHFYIELDNKIIAHANSAASTKFSSMIGGIAVSSQYRNKSFGKIIISSIALDIFKEGKIPCIFEKSQNNLLLSLGFKPYKHWGVIQINN